MARWSVPVRNTDTGGVIEWVVEAGTPGAARLAAEGQGLIVVGMISEIRAPEPPAAAKPGPEPEPVATLTDDQLEAWARSKRPDPIIIKVEPGRHWTTTIGAGVCLGMVLWMFAAALLSMCLFGGLLAPFVGR